MKLLRINDKAFGSWDDESRCIEFDVTAKIKDTKCDIVFEAVESGSWVYHRGNWDTPGLAKMTKSTILITSATKYVDGDKVRPVGVLDSDLIEIIMNNYED